MQINLPFAGDEESGGCTPRIRFLLPILPASPPAAPILDGQRNGILDNRSSSIGQLRRRSVDHGRRRAGAQGPIGEYSRAAAREGSIATRAAHPSGCCGTNGSTRAARFARFDRMAIEIRDASTCRRRRSWTSRTPR